MLYNKLVARGLKPYQALGALYGVGGETSTFDTGSTNPNDPHGGSFGLANWNGIRRTRLEQAADAAGVSRTDPNFQTDFLVNSIFDKNHVDYQPGVLKALQAAGDTGWRNQRLYRQVRAPEGQQLAAALHAGAGVHRHARRQ